MHAQNQIPWLRLVLAALLLLVLAGCDDEGSIGNRDTTGEPPAGEPPASQPISGVFHGRLVDGAEVNGVTATIAPDGETVYALRDHPNRALTTRAFVGTTQSTSSSVRFSGFVLEDGARIPIAFKANLESGVLTATLAGNLRLRLERLQRSDAGVSLAQLAGDYSFVAPNHTIWRATIRADGTISLSSTAENCTLRGQVAVPDTAVNVFTLKVPSGSCVPFREGLSGVGSVDTLPPASRLLRLDARSGDQPLQLNLFAT